MTARRIEDFEPVVGAGVGHDQKDLAVAFKEGKDGANDAIYERYEARVQSLCRRMLGDAHDAQEASQETFLRVYQGLFNFNGRYQLGAWITRIATNVCLDHLRSRTRRPADPTPVETMELDPEPSDRSDPEILFIRHAEGRHVRKVLATLPPLHKAAIVLRDFEGQSYEEIAITLGLTECQVKALLHRARMGFRRSWSATGLAAFLPWRFLHRFRKLDVAPKDSTTNALAPATQIMESAPHMAASCSTVLQQCGQMFSERAASLITAAVVGTAATGIAVTAPDALKQAPEPRPNELTVEQAVDPRDVTHIKPASSAEQHKSAKPVAAPVEPDPAPST
ncbi:MAG: RNA polymerase sigma factor, partial [Actinomycetota bacterium]